MKKLSLVVLTLLTVLALSACSDLCIGTECITGDVTAPTISGLTDLLVEMNGTADYALDVTAEDDFDGDLTSSIVIDSESVDLATAGAYYVSYTVTDEAGNETMMNRRVDVYDPNCSTGPDIQGYITYDHLNGHGTVTEDHQAFVLFEEQMLGYVKYQVTYLSCTCRNSDVNYWQVAYVEISTTDNTIQKISFNQDSDGDHPYTAGMWGDSSPTPSGKTLEDFEADFIPWLVGQGLDTLGGINVFTNDEYHGITNETVIAEQDLIDDFAGSSVSTNNMIRIMKSLLEYHEENY